MVEGNDAIGLAFHFVIYFLSITFFLYNVEPRYQTYQYI